jgi:putative hemolysin
MAFDEYMTPIISGNYTIRLCENEKELRQYQDLRYKYLILEFDPQKAETAGPDDTDYNMGYDENTVQLCAFYRDPVTGEEEVVGGYIMMRFKKDDDFCKATLKYDISNLLDKYKYQMCEITRGVVHPDHRAGAVTKLLWEGIKNYLFGNNLVFNIGTMSFMGLDPLKYTQAASFLYHYYRMPDDIIVRPLEPNAYYHDYLKKEDICRKTAISQLPPLLKGLLMVGAKTGEGFYIDHDLGVVEIFAFCNMIKDFNFDNFGKRDVLEK